MVRQWKCQPKKKLSNLRIGNVLFFFSLLLKYYCCSWFDDFHILHFHLSSTKQKKLRKKNKRIKSFFMPILIACALIFVSFFCCDGFYFFLFFFGFLNIIIINLCEISSAVVAFVLVRNAIEFIHVYNLYGFRLCLCQSVRAFVVHLCFVACKNVNRAI